MKYDKIESKIIVYFIGLYESLENITAPALPFKFGIFVNLPSESCVIKEYNFLKLNRNLALLSAIA